ncbi:hypothetical protein [Bifidobacterium longum]|uniref:hypothetical protein n=1 Tax=Bifidobacterium longum TaxID=216816 RepID=UPI003D070FB3
MRKPITALAITLAILALAGCATPENDGSGTYGNPKTGYINWYETPDHKARVQCWAVSSGASCDWDHMQTKDTQ